MPNVHFSEKWGRERTYQQRAQRGIPTGALIIIRGKSFNEYEI
jgi:hypothetical protein